MAEKNVKIIADGTNRLSVILPEGTNVKAFSGEVTVSSIAQFLGAESDVEGQACPLLDCTHCACTEYEYPISRDY